jgi:hypothetical protein
VVGQTLRALKAGSVDGAFRQLAIDRDPAGRAKETIFLFCKERNSGAASRD